MNTPADKAALRKFGKHLAALRKEKQISLRKLAEACNDLDHSRIAKIEKGEVNITISTMVELAKGLGVEPKMLMDYYTG